MSSPLLCEVANLVHGCECRLEIRKREGMRDVMPVHDLPLWHLLCERSWLFAVERQHSSPGRDTGLAGGFGHGVPPNLNSTGIGSDRVSAQRNPMAKARGIQVLLVPVFEIAALVLQRS
jgi:hypothetical protein